MQFQVNDRVKIIGGPLKGKTGVIAKFMGIFYSIEMGGEAGRMLYYERELELLKETTCECCGRAF